MNNKCAFCAQLVAYFIRCEECGEAICTTHRTAKPTLVARSAEDGNPLAATTCYLCLNHSGVAVPAGAVPRYSSIALAAT